jgi:hypothetical protein
MVWLRSAPMGSRRRTAARESSRPLAGVLAACVKEAETRGRTISMRAPLLAC